MFPPVIEHLARNNQIALQLAQLDRERERTCAILYFLDAQSPETISFSSEIAVCKIETLKEYLGYPKEKQNLDLMQALLQSKFRDLSHELMIKFRGLLSAREYFVDAAHTQQVTPQQASELEQKYQTFLDQKLQEQKQEFLSLCELNLKNWEGFPERIAVFFKRLISSLEEEACRGKENDTVLMESQRPDAFKKIALEEKQIKLIRQRREAIAKTVDNIFTACQVGAIEYVHQQCQAYWIAKNRVEFLHRANEQGFCPLHFAAYHSHPEIVSFLLRYNVDPNIPDQTGYRALHWAAKAGDYISTRILLDTGADPNAQGEYQRTPLHMAAFNHRPQICELLLERRANPNMRADNGKTPLHDAVIHGDTIIVAKLLKSNTIDVMIRDDANRTPLWYAVADGLVDVISMILSHPSWRNPDDDTDINHLQKLSAMEIRYNAGAVRASLDYYVSQHMTKV